MYRRNTSSATSSRLCSAGKVTAAQPNTHTLGQCAVSTVSRVGPTQRWKERKEWLHAEIACQGCLRSVLLCMVVYSFFHDVLVRMRLLRSQSRARAGLVVRTVTRIGVFRVHEVKRPSITRIWCALRSLLCFVAKRNAQNLHQNIVQTLGAGSVVAIKG